MATDIVTSYRDPERPRMKASLRIRAVTRGEAELLLEVQKASSVAGFGHVFPPDKHPFPDKAVLERWQKAVNDPAQPWCSQSSTPRRWGSPPCAPSGSTPSTSVPHAGAWASVRGSTITR